jgi:hypothetical protein
VNWKKWLYGLLSAAVNGAASGVVLVIAAPETFNLQAGWKRLLGTSATLGLLNAANYLKSSPAPEWNGVDRRLAVLLLLMLLPIWGCGAARQTPRHIAVMGETSFKTAVIQFGAAELALYESKVVPGLTLEKHREINAKLVAIDDAGIRVVQVLLAWPEGAPTPVELRTLITNIKWLVDEVTALLPDSAEKSKLLAYLSTAQGWLLSVIAPATEAHPDALALVTELEALHAH